MDERVLLREQVFAGYAAALAQALPEELRVLAFCGPASFREPEIEDCWHPRFLNESALVSLARIAPKFFRSLVAGLRRVLLGRFGELTFYSGSDSSVIGITPASICTIENGKMETAYCHPEDAGAISWMVFEDAGEARDEFCSRLHVVKKLGSFLRAWARVSFSHALLEPDVAVASLLTLSCILRLHWVCLLAFGLRVEKILKQRRPRAVFCVHEMWPWSRVVWDVLRRNGIAGVTIQHASITRSKLWYFPMPVELNAGFATPDTFAVFSEKEQSLLTSYYPNSTSFPLTCGSRYAYLKEQKMFRGSTSKHQAVGALSVGGFVLFVSSVPWWDVEVVLSAAQKLSVMDHGTGNREHETWNILIRLHPRAVVPRRWQQWLKAAQARGDIHVSKRRLREDLEAAAVVVGMNSTALEEATIMGRAVVVLEDSRYLSFATTLGMHCAVSALSWQSIEATVAAADDAFVAAGRNALGIDLPVVRLSEIVSHETR